MAEKDDKIDAARRRLLRVAVYVPPAVLGAVALNQAACQPASVCNPNVNCAPVNNCGPNGACGPNNCNPVINPCNPQSCNPSN